MSTPLSYKGLAIVQHDDEIYYGNPKDKYMVYLKILSQKEEGGISLADKIHVSLVATDENLDLIERIKKQGVKNGLYNALDVGAVWLQSALAEEK